MIMRHCVWYLDATLLGINSSLPKTNQTTDYYIPLQGQAADAKLEQAQVHSEAKCRAAPMPRATRARPPSNSRSSPG